MTYLQGLVVGEVEGFDKFLPPVALVQLAGSWGGREEGGREGASEQNLGMG